MAEISISFADIWFTLAIVATIGFIAFTFFYYRRTNPPLPTGMRVFLGVLRAIAILLLVFMLAEPVFSYLQIDLITPKIAFLVDGSESIKTVEDFERKKTYLESLIGEATEDRGTDDFEIHTYSFSDSVRPIGGNELSFDGKQTALGDCLKQLQASYRNDNLRGVIVASDGIANSGSDPLSTARNLGVEIHAIDLGPQRSSTDIRIVRVTHDDIGYEGKSSQVEIEVESRGFEGMTVPLRIRSAGKTLSTKEVVLAGDGARKSAEIQFTPEEQGVRTYSVSVPVQSDEQLSDNNSRSFSMKILKGKHRILLAASYLSWELTFLKRAIESSEDYETDISVADRHGRLGFKPIPGSADALSEYDLVILLDYPAGDLGPKANETGRYVSDLGGSVLLVLGYEFSREGLNSAMRELLPFESGRRPRMNSGRDFHPVLTEMGKHHPVMEIAEKATELQQRWNSLPPFSAFVEIGNEKPGATVLAVHPERNVAGELIPLIIASNSGKGKTLTMTMSPLWKVDFLAAARGSSDQAYDQFILNSVRWLVTSEDIERMRLAPDKPVFKSGERITFSASLLDQSYQPIDDASVIVTVLPDSTSETGDSLTASMVQTTPGRYTADLHLLEHGKYRYEAAVVRLDETIAEIDGTFQVERFSLEEETLYSRQDILKEVASATGGQYFTINNADSVFAGLDVESAEKRTRHEVSLANNWIVLLMVLILLSVEWAVRKRRQLL